VSDQQDDPAELAQLEMSGLFDAAWYSAQYPDVQAADIAPLVHFHRHGWREHRKPNAYFDPEWYLQHYPDVGGAGMNPLLHYIRHGDLEGRRPAWYFDPAWYREVYDIPQDAVALAHFLPQARSGQVAPMAEFWSVLHLAPYRDDAGQGEDPFLHYLDDMLRMRRAAFPDLDVVTASGLMDPNYYLINGTDVHEAKLDPSEHFCRYGWREGRKPNIYFNTTWYLQTNPLVARLKINPVVHYTLAGEMAGRRPVPYFDPAWYRATYEVPTGEVALAHFLTHRRSQAFSPTPLFDVTWYVEQHAEDVVGNRDPFAHFLQTGTYKDINPSPAFNAAAYRKRYMGRRSRVFRQLMHPDRDNPLVHHLRSKYR